ncbi:MAG: hypothetical protein HS113_08035 [Verrucomicrobiales bacterium]|nr:hypothetical protein [Verrucomicrobiales bacterium]
MPDPAPNPTPTKPAEIRSLYASLLELEDKLTSARAAESAKRTAAEVKLLADIAVANFDLSRAPDRFKTWQTEDAQLRDRSLAFEELLKKLQARLAELHVQHAPEVIEVLEAQMRDLETRCAREQQEADGIRERIRLIRERLRSVQPDTARPAKK